MAEAIADGADLVTFSGDKLLGGPQAGFVVGRKELIARLNRNPMKRALRVDKMRLAALEATLKLYRDPDRLTQTVPTLRALARPQPDIAALAQRLAAGHRQGGWASFRGRSGGVQEPDRLRRAAARNGAQRGPRDPADGGPRTGRLLAALSDALRRLPVPVIGRIEDGSVILDLRCLDDEAAFAENLASFKSGTLPMIIGTAGHIDHGKTALVRALTGVDTDRLKEEKARGISIDLGFAYLPSPDGTVLGFVDVPGHEKFVHNMLAGATGIDFVLLVVAADDGIMPQTREHLAIIDLLGITRGIVALTKSDLVDGASRADVASAITQALADDRTRRRGDRSGLRRSPARESMTCGRGCLASRQ